MSALSLELLAAITSSPSLIALEWNADGAVSDGWVFYTFWLHTLMHALYASEHCRRCYISALLSLLLTSTYQKLFRSLRQPSYSGARRYALLHHIHRYHWPRYGHCRSMSIRDTAHARTSCSLLWGIRILYFCVLIRYRVFKSVGYSCLDKAVSDRVMLCMS